MVVSCILVCVFLIIWSFGGYLIPYLPFLFKYRFTPKANLPFSRETPFNGPLISCIIPAFNEAEELETKIQNTLQCLSAYPNLEILIITDGSTDNSSEILLNYPQITHLHIPERGGKVGAINRAAEQAKGTYIVFTDANTHLDPLAFCHVANIFENWSKAGAISGKKTIRASQTDSAAGSGEGLYWKYENFLKKCDACIETIVGAPGEFFAIRTELFTSIPKAIILDDFWLSMHVNAQAYQVIFAPYIVVSELPSLNTSEEWKRKVRIAAGGWQVLSVWKSNFNFLKWFNLSYLLFWHRAMRWWIVPFLLPLLLGFSLYYFYTNNVNLHQYTLIHILTILQIIFYLVAYIGYVVRDKRIPIPGFTAPYYFTFMNLAVWFGALKYFKNSQSSVWERSQRQSASASK